MPHARTCRCGIGDAGSDELAVWLLAYVQASAAPVATRRLAAFAVERGWKRYDVHTQLSQWLRAGALALITPGVYTAHR
jgi:hypothetical protein